MRVIDADVLLAELKPIDYEAEHSAVLISDVAKIMREWVERQTTITPQNDPMTCDGCVDCKRSSMSMCKFCIRNTELRDYYRRPPEGEEET